MDNNEIDNINEESEEILNEEETPEVPAEDDNTEELPGSKLPPEKKKLYLIISLVALVVGFFVILTGAIINNEKVSQIGMDIMMICAVAYLYVRNK